MMEKYEIVLTLDRPQLLIFYSAMDKSWRNWSGGDPYEQEMLRVLKDKAFIFLMESQFEG